MVRANSRWFILFVLMNLISMFFFPKTGHTNTNWLSYFRRDSMLNTYKRAYAVLDDSLWVGTFGDGIKIKDGSKTINLTSGNTRSSQRRDDGLISDYITSILIDQANNRVWIGTNAGLASCNLEGKEWERYTTANGLPNNVIRDLALDSHGILWAATSMGLGAFDGENWKIYNESNGLPQNSVRSLNVQGDSLWIGTIGGAVSRYRSGEWKTVMTF